MYDSTFTSCHFNSVMLLLAGLFVVVVFSCVFSSFFLGFSL